MEEIIITIKAIFMCTSFLIGGLLCYFHWEAMLISHVAMRVTRIPFNNMEELLDSDYNFFTYPGSSNWDSFKYGNTLWQRIYQEKLEPFKEDYKQVQFTSEFALMNEKNAFYSSYYRKS